MTIERSVSDNHSQFIKHGIKFRLLQEEVKTLSELNYKEIIDDLNTRIVFNEKTMKENSKDVSLAKKNLDKLNKNIESDEFKEKIINNCVKKNEVFEI